MRILDTVKEGLRIAWTYKSLWLFGFFVGLGSANEGGQADPGPAAPGQVGAADADGALGVIVALPLAVLAVAALVMLILSEGALIEGVRRARRGETQSVRAGFREGWAHWGSVFLIKVIYLAVTAGSIVIPAAVIFAVALLVGVAPAVLLLGIPAVLVAVPWLVTLYIWQAFAVRIAVLENRRTVDAIGKARLFLHGRLLHGLKLIVAAFVGSLFIVLAGIAVVAPFALLGRAGLFEALGPVVLIVVIPLLVPAFAVLVAIVGTFRSSVWTIGYLSEAEA